MVIFTIRLMCKLLIVISISSCLTGCAWIVGVALAGTVSTVVFTAGSVSDIDKTEKALAVEKLIYAFEANNGTVNDLSFVDGYVKGNIDDYNVTAYIYVRRDGILDINVRATKYLISSSNTAQKIIDKYRNYIR